ncbi:MAG: hypothetical protein JKY02_04670 [Flavobacteriaceae bacterium]|nr:hypothetical protein [Flavobacteriaceae bacterium]
MESYLIKSSVCLAVLYFMYRFIFKNDSHHQLKRLISFICILFACSFLFIPLGNLIVFDTYPEIMNFLFMRSSEGFQEGLSKVIPEEVTSIYLSVYLIGLVVFAFRSFFGLAVLIRWYITSRKSRKWGFTVVHVDKKIAPFTFFRILFIGKEVLNDEAMNTLIVHEQYHRDQLHSMDTVILEILTVVYWFNPVVWLFQKDIKTEHEYMADAQVLKKGFDAVSYQYLLFQTRTGVSLQLGSHFSNKTNLKKRFEMMNTRRVSTNKSYVKAFLFLPIMLMIFMFSAFTEANRNLSREIVLDKPPVKKILKNEKFEFMVSGNTSNENRHEPIFILQDGKKESIVSSLDMSKLNPNNITSVQVIKDKAAIKKYGKKGENGVIIIELKKK